MKTEFTFGFSQIDLTIHFRIHTFSSGFAKNREELISQYIWSERDLKNDPFVAQKTLLKLIGSHISGLLDSISDYKVEMLQNKKSPLEYAEETYFELRRQFLLFINQSKNASYKSLFFPNDQTDAGFTYSLKDLIGLPRGLINCTVFKNLRELFDSSLVIKTLVQEYYSLDKDDVVVTMPPAYINFTGDYYCGSELPAPSTTTPGSIFYDCSDNHLFLLTEEINAQNQSRLWVPCIGDAKSQYPRLLIDFDNDNKATGFIWNANTYNGPLKKWINDSILNPTKHAVSTIRVGKLPDVNVGEFLSFLDERYKD